jgi:hypothetical protein
VERGKRRLEEGAEDLRERDEEGEAFKVSGTEGRKMLSEKRRKMNEEEYVYNTVNWNYHSRCAR